ANVFACRSPRASSFSLGLFTNRLLLCGVAVELGLLGLIVYHPVGHRIFGTAPFDGRFWWPLLVFAALLLLAEEARKGLVRRHDMGRNLRYQEGTA
ncbi:MAG: Calcium-transporting ATPase, partial [candidate division NC10 bacterium]|nr:Calcium-transporting ATPase [candidate division NC10 bacterium]